MKKVFLLFFVLVCLGSVGVVLWTSQASARRVKPVRGDPGCQKNLEMCTADLGMCNADLGTCNDDVGTCTTNLGACEADLTECEAQPPAPVPQTGQTTCWDNNGNVIDCTLTGQDGELQAGAVPPVPRFTDNTDGTITDNLTGLVWLKDANCLGGTATWQDALDFANGLFDGCTDCGPIGNEDCGLSDGSAAGDWRLPNRKELESLLDLGNFNLALPTGHPFINFGNDYWSSTTFAFGGDFAWVVGFISGVVDGSDKHFGLNVVLPVRGGS